MSPCRDLLSSSRKKGIGILTSLAIHMTTPPLAILATIGLFWLVQPFLMQALVIHQSRGRVLVLILIYLVVTLSLASNLHESLRDRPKPIRPVFLILLWYPPAMQLIRYFHALAVGGTAFANHFGLSTFSEVAIFTLSVPTVKFQNDETRKKDIVDVRSREKIHRALRRPGDNKLWKDFGICCMDLAVTVLGCGLILVLKLDILLPQWMQRIVRVYIMGFSTAIIKLVFELPCRFLLRNHKQVHFVAPIYDQPYLACSPRDLWHRWSVTAGYHYRKGFYEPLIVWLRRGHGTKSNNDSGYLSLWVAAAAPFFVNCVLHIYWWSLVVKGSIDYSYINLLFLFPLVSFWGQDIVVGQLLFSARTANSLPHRAANYAILVVAFYSIGQQMSDAHALPPTLSAVCRANVFLSPLP
jgi:hypothetical protein